jgi:peptide/nickel transport system substrate-binding protein
VRSTTWRSPALALALSFATLAALVGCAASEPETATDEPVRVGTTLEFSALDPVCATAPGDLQVVRQVFPRLLVATDDSDVVEPELAETAAFTAPGDFTVTLKPGLEFANGNELTSADVAFSFERQLDIGDGNSALSNLGSVDVVDDMTLVFHPTTAGDAAFPTLLASSAGSIVDEHTFPADECGQVDDIVAGAGFAGQYLIPDLDADPETPLLLEPNPAYGGTLPAVRNVGVELTAFADAAALLGALDQGRVDVALDGVRPADLDAVGDDTAVRLLSGPSGAIRSLVFDFAAQPFGTASAEPNATKAQAVRQAVAALVDRDPLAEAAGAAFEPLVSFLPDGVSGAEDVLGDTWGDGRGGPDEDQAEDLLVAAGVATPVSLGIQYPDEHFGASSQKVLTQLQEQLESSGLFDVTLASSEWSVFDEQRTAHGYPTFYFGWSPATPDALAYLAPYIGPPSVLSNDGSTAELQQLVAELAAAADADAREGIIERIQAAEAVQLSTIPLLQGLRFVGVRDGVEGLDLDRPLEIRFGSITRP